MQPFGIAQVGKSYRNEISNTPFTRLREFTQAEVEYFVDPESKCELNELNALNLNEPITMYSAYNQQNNLPPIITTLNDAYNTGIVKDSYIMMFLSKLKLFADTLGLINYRFRQHKCDEMAHYAKDCWDLELLNGDKYLECAGLAHRGDYDLKAHNINEEFALKKLYRKKCTFIH